MLFLSRGLLRNDSSVWTNEFLFPREQKEKKRKKGGIASSAGRSLNCMPYVKIVVCHFCHSLEGKIMSAHLMLLIKVLLLHRCTTD